MPAWSMDSRERIIEAHEQGEGSQQEIADRFRVIWSKVKAYLETRAARDRQALLKAIAEAHDTVTADNAAHWYAHCGYPDLK